MTRLLLMASVLLLLGGPARAQEDGGDIEAGFHLGKFYATASMLATDLLVLTSLAEELDVASITQENYDSGVITDDDLQQANLVLAYAIWRVQFMLAPACEAGLEDDAFSHPVMAEFEDPTQTILIEVLRLSEEFYETADYEYLARFSENLAEGEYAEQLFSLAEQAWDQAGIPD